MRSSPKISPRMSMVQAIGWIVGSTLVVGVVGQFCLSHWKSKTQAFKEDPQYRITRIVQTGPKKEALSTLCLSEVMGLSIDRPLHLAVFDQKEAEKRLHACPVIEKARVTIEKPNTLHIDYQTRYPIALLYDYVNMGIDEQQCCFPINPYFSSKNLPEIYLGLFAERFSPMQMVWNQPLQDDRLTLAMSLLRLFGEKGYQNLFSIRRIDVSSAYAESCGQRQVVLTIEETMRKAIGKRDVLFIFPLYLRFSVKNINQEIGNYLILRKKIWDSLSLTTDGIKENEGEVTLPPRVIDLRIEGLAFID